MLNSKYVFGFFFFLSKVSFLYFIKSPILKKYQHLMHLQRRNLHNPFLTGGFYANFIWYTQQFFYLNNHENVLIKLSKLYLSYFTGAKNKFCIVFLKVHICIHDLE